MDMNSQEIRLRILKLLYEKDEEKPNASVRFDTIKSDLGLEDEHIRSNIKYLEDKGYIEISKRIHYRYHLVKISSDGKDIIENKSLLKNEFPSIQIIVQKGKINIANQGSQNTSVEIDNNE